MDDAFDMIDRHSANYQRRASDLAKQYAGGKTITVSETARMLNTGKQTVRRMVKDGILIEFIPANRSILLFNPRLFC